MSTRRRRTTAALTAAATLIGAAAVTAMAGPAVAAPPSGHGPTDLRVATYNLSLNRNATVSSSPTCRPPTIRRRPPSPRSSSAPDRTSSCSTSSTTSKGSQRSTCSATTTSRCRRTAPTRSSTSTRSPRRRTRASESGFDLNNDGTVGGPDDAFGFGEFPGQYGMVVLSQFPIVDRRGPHVPAPHRGRPCPARCCPTTPQRREPADWYSPEELAVVRLSSKSHWDVPVDVNGRIVHVLAAHPTPPAFDGEEDRNGLRNPDEIRFWADYVASDDTAWLIFDDAGSAGGLVPDAEFVILGDQNSDPLDGDSLAGRSSSCSTSSRCRTRRRRAKALSKPPRSRPGRTRPTKEIRRSTPQTSPTTRPATSAPTTCSRPRGSR